jgi:hypothetical protein
VAPKPTPKGEKVVKSRPAPEQTFNFTEEEGSEVRPIDPIWKQILFMHTNSTPAGVIRSNLGNTNSDFITPEKLDMESLNRIASDLSGQRDYVGPKATNTRQIVGLDWGSMPAEARVAAFPKIKNPTEKQVNEYQEALSEAALNRVKAKKGASK